MSRGSAVYVSERRRRLRPLRILVDLETAQTRLGHTDPRLTLGIYAQASTEADRHAAERLGDRFIPKRDHDRGRGLV